MKVMVLQIPQDEDEVVMNQFTVLSEHANGYSYELGNFSVPLEREELNKHMDIVVSDTSQTAAVIFNKTKEYIENNNELLYQNIPLLLY